MHLQALFNEEVTQQLSQLLFVSASDRKDHRQRLVGGDGGGNESQHICQSQYNQHVTSHSHAVTRSFATIHCFPQATEATSALFLLAAANRPVTQSQHAIPYVLALCDADLRALPVTKLEVVASVLLLFFGCGRSLALKK